MPRRVLVRGSTEKFDLVEVPAPNEKHLQEIMKVNPALIPAEDLGHDGELLVVGRETTLASGAIDLLCLARSGDLVLIEFKTGPQNPDFRSALAQLIDYGSDLWKQSVSDFDQGVVQRFIGSPHCEPKFKIASSLRQLVDLTTWNLAEEEWAQLENRLSDVLATGDFDFVVAAQRFTQPMTASLEYLNSSARFGRYFLIQIVRLEGNDMEAYSAQVVARPTKGSAASSSGSTAGQINEADFLNTLPAGDYRAAMEDILAAFKLLGLNFGWGTKGTSFRLQTEDRAEPLSIGWAFPEGTGWLGVRHLSWVLIRAPRCIHPRSPSRSTDTSPLLRSSLGACRCRTRTFAVGRSIPTRFRR